MGLIVSMPINREETEKNKKRSKVLKQFVIPFLSSTSSCAKWFSRSVSMEWSLVMHAFIVVTELSNFPAELKVFFGVEKLVI